MNAAVMSVLPPPGEANVESDGDQRLAARSGWPCVLALCTYAAAGHVVSVCRGVGS